MNSFLGRAAGLLASSALVGLFACASSDSVPNSVDTPLEVRPGAPSGVTHEEIRQADWGSGYCSDVFVRNTSDEPLLWEVRIPIEGSVRDLWGAQYTEEASAVVASALDDSPTLSGHGEVRFGFCVNREDTVPAPKPDPEPSPAPTPLPSPEPSEGPVTPPGGTAAILPPLSTQGGRILDAAGNTVVLTGVNWFGFETTTHLPHGLWSRDYKDMLSQMASLGYNLIRLPYSIEAVRSSEAVTPSLSGGMNAELRDKTPLEAMDVIIAEAGRLGLLVLLDNHSASDDQHLFDLWYGEGGFTELDWLQTWTLLAERYKHFENVVGADVHNEPHGRATWGDGGPTDFRRAATLAGNAIHTVAPKWLIVVEGVEGPVPGQTLDRHWWGGNLEGVRRLPVVLETPHKLVYSPHEYGPGVHDQPWFSSPEVSSILRHRWDVGFGFLVDEDLAPVLVGEFGGRETGLDTVEGRWQNQFVDYLAEKGISFTYWSWNPNSGDTGGILLDDWQTVDTSKQAMLSRALGVPPADAPDEPSSAPMLPHAKEPADLTQEPESEPKPPGTLSFVWNVAASWETGFCTDAIQVTNQGHLAVATWSLEFHLSNADIGSSWNGSTSSAGHVVSVTPPAWGARIEPGQTVATFGFCAQTTAPGPKLTRISVR